ncbi:hypothetical protein PLICRDRAFT_698924 [Plicaturopsis crispa FD-325 SS-3]|nr:hypothetical protein PLICRDRAFT_698924 [Plicaturopsis crispa FD-325 SS-3]
MSATATTTKKKPLFAPAEGSRYVHGDYLKALTQQPLNPLPSYLVPRNCKKLAPPILRYGWAIDEGAIMKFAEEHDLVLVCGPDNTPNVEDTISDPAIILAIVEHLGIHDTGHMGFEAAFENGDYIYIFVVGTNYTSFPIQEEQAKLKEFFGGAPGRWFLDLEEWQWKRSAKAPPFPTAPARRTVDHNMPNPLLFNVDHDDDDVRP